MLDPSTQSNGTSLVDSQVRFKLEAIAASYSKGDLNLQDEDRKLLLEACDRVKTALATPMETVIDLLMSTQRRAAVRLAVEMGIFDVVASGKGGVTDVNLLSEKTKADPLLIIRTMRLLSAMGFVNEVGPGEWTSTHNSEALAGETPLKGMTVHFCDSMAPIFAKMPEYFRLNSFNNPIDADNSPFQYGFDTELHQFEWLKAHPEKHRAHNLMMTAPNRSRGKPWHEYFPVEERLSGAAPDSALLVDVGGGVGVDLASFRTRFPDLPGKCILEDLPTVVDQSEDAKAGRIEAIGLDFFAPQPVKGAKVYYLRNVLHDWPEKQAKEILGNIREAMGADSIVLLYELALPEAGCSLWSAQMDFTMMAMLGALERTKAQWEGLLDSAGFEMAKIWTPADMNPGLNSLMEAHVKKSE